MFFEMHGEAKMAGGRSGARWLVAATVVIACSSAVSTASGTQRSPQISVTEAEGVYSVAATFTVTAAPSTVREALTDYDRIPRFMPEVQTSNVLERTVDRVVVEQEAVARLMMFSKRVHLVLEVEEGPKTIRFRDRCGKSFTRYEGVWTVAGRDNRTDVTYHLVAHPAFDVPGFVLKRLLKRDAAAMIRRLSLEIASRTHPGSD